MSLLQELLTNVADSSASFASISSNILLEGFNSDSSPYSAGPLLLDNSLEISINLGILSLNSARL